VEAIAKHAKKPLDAHLMIVDPDRYITHFRDIGINYLSIHYEACTHLHRTLGQIRKLNMKAGVALNPHTPIEFLTDVLEEADFVVIMSVNPGFSGQRFISHTYSKVKRLKEMICLRGVDCLIQVDGGVNHSNSKQLLEAGTDILVAGNAVFNTPDPATAIDLLKVIPYIESP